MSALDIALLATSQLTGAPVETSTASSAEAPPPEAVAPLTVPKLRAASTTPPATRSVGTILPTANSTRREGTLLPSANSTRVPRIHKRVKSAASTSSSSRGGNSTLVSRLQDLIGGTTSGITTRIIGGVDVPRNRFPFVASLRQEPQDFHFCGGTLIHPRVVMTAAHCLDQSDPSLEYPTVELNKFYNIIPEANVVTTRCATSIVHEGWSFNTGQNDVALCILASNVTTVQPVNLARSPLTDPNTALTVMGWGSQAEGATNSATLQMTTVYLTNITTCNATYGGRIGLGQYCAGLPLGGADACQGDSGGPLLVMGSALGRDVQHGIVSWGSGCGEAGKPGVYTMVAAYIPWIQGKLQTYLGTTLPPPYTPNTTTTVNTTTVPAVYSPPPPSVTTAQQSASDSSYASPLSPPSPPSPLSSTLINAWDSLVQQLLAVGR